MTESILVERRQTNKRLVARLALANQASKCPTLTLRRTYPAKHPSLTSIRFRPSALNYESTLNQDGTVGLQHEWLTQHMSTSMHCKVFLSAWRSTTLPSCSEANHRKNSSLKP